MQRQDEGRPGISVRGSALLFVGLAGVTAALTCVFLAMRAVMDIGGACASGGPYVPTVGCPQGVPLLMIGGIWLGLIFAGIYIWQAVKQRAPSFAGFLWPALFLSLGWNFLEYGLDPPFGEGLAWGWLVCAVVFALMGGLPLLAAVPATWRSIAGRGSERVPVVPRRRSKPDAPGEQDRWRGWEGVMGRAPLSVTPSPGAASAATPTPSATATATAASGEDLVTALERLDALHRSGALNDTEYQAAKARLLGGGR